MPKTYESPHGCSILDGVVPGGELSGAVRNRNASFHVRDPTVFRDNDQTHKPESNPCCPSAVKGRQGSSKEDSVTVWFFWWLA
jgi:hypothetical protein